MSVIEEAQVEVRQLKRENSRLKNRASGNQESAHELPRHGPLGELKKKDKLIEKIKEGEQ